MRQYLTGLLFAALCASAHGAVPTFAALKAAHKPSDASLLDRHGQVIQSVRIDAMERRSDWLALSDVSPAMLRTLLLAEDKRFMEHKGVDYGAIGQAALDNLFRPRPRGASTITMQLAGLLDPALAAGQGGRSIGQKFDQARAALELERSWNKQQVLEAYLNLVPFRGDTRGLGAAASRLFGKHPSGLNLSESAILAALVRAPSANEKVVARRACGLLREIDPGTGCADIEWDTARALLRPAQAPASGVALQAARKLPPGSRSTLDGKLQQFASTALRQQLLQLRERNVNDGAVVVLDNANGEILAYVGNGGHGQVDGVTALRQAGSTLKPFLFGLAIERKLLTAASLIEDAPLTIAADGGAYVPQNYDHSYRGLVSVRTSLAASLNIPAVRTVMLLGVDAFQQRLRAVGLSSLTQGPEYYGQSLALGGAEVSLLELTNAYRTLANACRFTPATLTARGASSASQVCDPAAAWIVGDILSDRAARSVTFGLKNDLATTYWSAVKTGTSKDMRDNWALGYSPRYTVGVWVGNFDGQPMWDVSGVSGAAPVWREIMDFLHAGALARQPPAPAGVVRQALSYIPDLEPSRSEWFLKGTELAFIEVAAPAMRRARIEYPAANAILALDPDIPEHLERVAFKAQAGKGLRWRLDGRDLGDAGAGFMWKPVAGQHTLALVGQDGRAVDQVDFSVRGSR
jgi:penicillin-binding protein 1C